MANHKQALKRHRQSLKRQARNNYAKATMRTFLKKARTTLADAEADATEAVKNAVSYLDHIAGKGIIPKERASRLKSRLESKLNKV